MASPAMTERTLKATGYPYPQDALIMMTLAGLANISTAPRPGNPSPETLQQQQQRIQDGISDMLQNTSLATAGKWNAVWVGLSQVSNNQLSQTGDANLSYIATGTDSEGNAAVAVVVRGTTNAMEIAEDQDASTQVLWPSGSSSVTGSPNVSQGMYYAYNYVTAAPGGAPGAIVIQTTTGKSLLQEVQNLVNSGKATVYVTGHSLGGAVATMVALYLQQKLTGTFTIKLYTFAAPTAGNSPFANAVDKLKPMCYINHYDAVPYAYASLAKLSSLYPSSWNLGSMPNIGLTTKQEHGASLIYAQPTQQAALNKDGMHCAAYPSSTLTPWEEEAAFQHENPTYLALLGATTVSSPPLPWSAPAWSKETSYSGGDVVSQNGENYIATKDPRSSQPPSNPWSPLKNVNLPTPTITSVSVSGSQVTIGGSNFGSSQGGDNNVDIGIGSATPPPTSYSAVTAFTSWSPTQIVFTTPQTPSTGQTLYVYVTTEYGTSAAGTWTPPS